jgi:hypothetical protein
VLNHRHIILISIFFSLNLLLGCEKEAPQVQVPETSAAQPTENPAGLATGTVIETIDASVYTYVQVDTNGEKIWLAGPKTVITQGGSINVNTDAPMNNFHSKALNRDFPVIYFVGAFSGSAVQSAPTLVPASTTELPPGHTPVTDIKTMTAKNMELSEPVKRIEDGHTIAEIINNRKELSGKTVKVRGMVTKFTANVMNKNWIHMIDGSSDKDLTVITDQLVTTEQMIVIEGKVLLDKDFGYGYFYELLIEDAKVTVE